MSLHRVHVTRSYSVQVDAPADSPQAAEARVGRCDFDLPAIETWSGHKDWSIEAEEVESWR